MFGSSILRRPVLNVALAAGCACAAVMFAPKEARADGYYYYGGRPASSGSSYGHFDLGIDGDATALLAPSPDKNNLSTLGSGVKLRLGDHFRFRGGLNLTPEVGYAFDHIFSENSGTPENMNRFFAGLRIGFGRYVVPTLYGHIGYGFRSDHG